MPGQFADLAVLDRNYLTVPDDEIKAIESVLTMVAGRPTHASGSFEGMVSELPPIQPDWSPVGKFGGYQRAS